MVGEPLPQSFDWGRATRLCTFYFILSFNSSYLKLSTAGRRDNGNQLIDFGRGFYWTSTAGSTRSRYLEFSGAVLSVTSSSTRSMGNSVRCIKN